MRRVVWLCRDHDTEDGSTSLGGEELAGLATLPSCRVAGFLLWLVNNIWGGFLRDDGPPSPTFLVKPLKKEKEKKWTGILAFRAIGGITMAIGSKRQIETTLILTHSFIMIKNMSLIMIIISQPHSVCYFFIFVFLSVLFLSYLLVPLHGSSS